MGVTNPTAPVVNENINQTSMARLVSINAIDDFCLFAPPEPDSEIGDTEDREVAWCVQPRNNARVIPDGTFHAVHFVKTPLYWQVQGWGDFTKLNIKAGDQGGELDPHGATGLGNPVGGNVTTNATGADVNYEEWMNYMSFQQFCIRICIAESDNVTAALQCQHTLDEMGCNWVMPGDYTNGTFTECEADAAYPPGIYVKNGVTSTFAQRYTGTYTDKEKKKTGLFTVGQTVTPSSAMSVPASSKCTTYSTISNGIPTALLLQTDKVVPYTSGQTSFEGVPENTAAPTDGGDAKDGEKSSDKAAPGTDASSAKQNKSGASPIAAALGLSAVSVVVGGLAVFL